MERIFPELIATAFFLATVASTAAWLRTRHRLAESRRERKDLANSSLVIEEERRVLELVARGASLNEVLDTLTRAIERISPESLCTILLLDEENRHYLVRASMPSIPGEYMPAGFRLEIGPDVGACGSAAFRNEAIVVEDIATDFRFAGPRDFVMSFGLRSCWSMPIRDSKSNVLGTFAMYRRQPSKPRPEELRLVRAAAQLAGNAIARLRAERRLCETAERLNLAEKAASFGIWEVDAASETVVFSDGLAALLELGRETRRMSLKQLSAMLHPGDRDVVRAAMDRAIGTGDFEAEFRIMLPDGSIRWERGQGRVQIDGNQPTGATGALIDITKEKHLLVQLREAHAAAEAAAHSAHDAELLEQDRKTVLELVARDQPLDEIVMVMASVIARRLPGSLCSVQLELPNTLRLAVSPRIPEPFATALGRLAIASVYETFRAEPIAKLSSQSEWQDCIQNLKNFPSERYRAVPILRNNRRAGVILSFCGEARGSQAEDRSLEPWGQFASLAVDRRRLYDQLSCRAQHDDLTSLLNRGSLYERLEVQIDLSAREGSSMAVLYLDLDGFKEINDQHGHAAGDAVLQSISRRILANVRHTDIAARIGGDEFVVILPRISDRAEANRVGDLIVSAISQSNLFNGRELCVGASLGISLYPVDGTRPDTLLKVADEDMYRVKLERKTRPPDWSQAFPPGLVTAWELAAGPTGPDANAS
jgi:diguanylate cyclase (GGDEF)-like protein